MTSFLTPGLGGIGSKPSSTDTRALQDIDSTKKTFVNKDFVKNISYLNQSVDTLSQWSQKLQSGVDQANENALEQIQGFAADLFTAFAGLTPTGIDLGDLKYVLQGLGAFLGIDPDTPFPLNLFQAALHLFTTYIIPLDQFTDVIFDAIDAWAVELGLPPEFIDALHDLFDAISSLGASFFDLFNSLGDLLGAFGFLNFTSISGIGDIWDALVELIDGIVIPVLKPVLSILATLGLPFIQALTQIVNFGSSLLDPLKAISGGQVKSLGANAIPIPSADTTTWGVGSNNVNAWLFDAATSAVGSDGSFTTLGNGLAKRMLKQATNTAVPGQVFTVKAAMKWSGVPLGSNDFGVCMVWYTGATEVSQSNLAVSTGHGANGGFSTITGDFTAPINVDGFRVGARIGTGVNTGQIWIDDISVQLQGKIDQNLISGLVDFIGGFLTGDSPINVLGLFGNIPSKLLGLIGLGQIGNVAPNLLTAPGFDTPDSIGMGVGWSWDAGVGKTSMGCAKCVAGSANRELDSNQIEAAAGQTVSFSAWMQWSALSYSGTTTPITMGVNRYLAGVLVGYTQIAAPVSPATNQSSFLQFQGTWTVPGDCDAFSLVFKVSSQVSSGTIWFDDAEAKKTGLIQQGWVSGLLSSLGGLGDFIQGLLDTLVGIIRGIPFVGGVLGDLFDQFTGQTSIITSTSATTNQILAALGPGNPDADDFERVNVSNLGSKWTIYQTGPGTVAIPNGHDATFLYSGLTSSAEFIAISDVKALGNNPQAAIVFGTSPGAAADLPFFPPSAYAKNSIWLKVADTTTSWANVTGLRCMIDAAKNVLLDWFLNGVPTNLYTGTFALAPTSGTSFSFESGIGAINRRHVAKFNGTPIMDFTEIGTVSQFGAGYLRRAFGGRITQSIFNPASPASAKQWTAQG